MELVKQVQRLPKPDIPEAWDYRASVESMRHKIYKWKHLTKDMLAELWIAHEKLAREGRPKTGINVPVSWDDYCGEIGINRHTPLLWFQREGWLDVREEQRQIARHLEWPTGKYRVIYADPPWHYDKGKPLSQRKYGEALKHYPTMKVEEICAVPVVDLCTDNSVLFLWATMPKLPEALQVMRSWGFDYKTGLVWDKVKHNWGYYFSMRHELLLVGGRKRSTPDVAQLFDSVVSIERSEEHSSKPAYFRQLIDTLYPSGPRIELFARETAENWDAWGYDV